MGTQQPSFGSFTFSNTLRPCQVVQNDFRTLVSTLYSHDHDILNVSMIVLFQIDVEDLEMAPVALVVVESATMLKVIDLKTCEFWHCFCGTRDRVVVPRCVVIAFLRMLEILLTCDDFIS